MFLRTKLLGALLLLSLPALAQKRFVAADMETRKPIGGVNITTSTLSKTVSDSLGRFDVADSCLTMVLTHVGYESTLVNTTEAGDTIYLLSKLMLLPDVPVFGKLKPEESLEQLNKRLRLSKQEAQLAAAKPSSGFNILPLLSKLFKKKNKLSRKERLKKVLEEY